MRVRAVTCPGYVPRLWPSWDKLHRSCFESKWTLEEVQLFGASKPGRHVRAIEVAAHLSVPSSLLFSKTIIIIR